MENKDVNSLIDNLATDLKPVTPMPSLAKRVIVWIVIALLCLSAGMAIIGIRHDLSIIIKSPRFLVETGLLIMTALTAAISAFIISIPGEERGSKKLLQFVPLVLWFISLISFFILAIIGNERVEIGHGLVCSSEILLLGIAPAIALFYMVKKGATTMPVLTGIIIMVAAFSLSGFALQLTCKNDNPIHILVYHFAPVIFIAISGSWLGKKFLKW